MFKMSLTAKKVNYIFKPLHLNIIVDKLFFSGVVNSWRKDSQAKENRYLSWTADRGGEHNTSRHTEYTYYFFISNCSNGSNFNFCFISDCEN